MKYTVYGNQVLLARGVCREFCMTDDDIPTLSQRSFDRTPSQREKSGFATREARRPESHGRQSPIKPDFESRRVGIEIQSQINLPAIPREHDKKKFCYRDSSPGQPRYADAPRSCSRVLKIDNMQQSSFIIFERYKLKRSNCPANEMRK